MLQPVQQEVAIMKNKQTEGEKGSSQLQCYITLNTAASHNYDNEMPSLRWIKWSVFVRKVFNQRITRLTLSKLTSDYRVARTYATLKTNSARP